MGSPVSGSSQYVARGPLGWRSTLSLEAWQPESDVELRVCPRCVIPIEDHGATAAEAQVVAPDVEVNERSTLQWRFVGRGDQLGKRRVQPRSRAQSERQEPFRTSSDHPPVRPISEVIRGNVGWRGRRVDLRHSIQHEPNSDVVPGRRPVRVRQIFEHQRRPARRIIKAEDVWQKRAAQRLIISVFGADPLRCHLGRTDLDEGGAAVAVIDDPSRCRRAAAPVGGGPTEPERPPAEHTLH